MSCLNQDLPLTEYEIVVVNDGTKDNSMKIVEDLARDYNNIIIITQNNQGLSAARNNGFQHASGKYVWFVDSDDWIENDSLKEIVSLLEMNHLEGLVHSGIRYIDDEHVTFAKTDYPQMVLSGREYMASEVINCAAVKTIYLRDFLVRYNLRFFKGIFHEDIEFTPRAYYYIQKLGFTNHHYYYNRLTPGSITQKPNPQKAFDLIVVAQHLYAFKREHDMSGIDQSFDHLIGMSINQSLYQCRYMDASNKSKIKRVYKNNRRLFKSFLNSPSLKYKLEGLLLLVCPSLCIEFYSTMYNHN